MRWRLRLSIWNVERLIDWAIWVVLRRIIVWIIEIITIVVGLAIEIWILNVLKRISLISITISFVFVWTVEILIWILELASMSGILNMHVIVKQSVFKSLRNVQSRFINHNFNWPIFQSLIFCISKFLFLTIDNRFEICFPNGVQSSETFVKLFLMLILEFFQEFDVFFVLIEDWLEILRFTIFIVEHSIFIIFFHLFVMFINSFD